MGKEREGGGVEEPGRDRAHREGDEGLEDAPPQLAEALEQRPVVEEDPCKAARPRSLGQWGVLRERGHDAHHCASQRFP